MIAALIVSRRRNYSILRRSSATALPRQRSPDGASRSSEETLVDPDIYEEASDSDDAMLLHPISNFPKRTSSANRALSFPDTDPPGQYTHLIHSRILQKFPFLIEMFYWGLNYLAYLFSKEGAVKLHNLNGKVNVQLAEDHGIGILNFEHQSMFSFLFFIPEVDVQRFFLKDHVGTMTILNQIYSLVHIPGTVACVSLRLSCTSPLN